MAEECSCVIYAIDHVQDEHFDSLTKNQLENAVGKLSYVALSLVCLEKAHAENRISTQLKEQFMEALGVFADISSYMNDQSKKSETIEMISKMLKIIRLENIAERVKTSKPSISSSLITMEMVESVAALLDCFDPILLVFDRKRREAAPTPVLRKKLRYLGLFLRLTAKRCIEHESIKDLFTYAEDVAYDALHLCFLELAYNKETDDYQSNVLDCEFSKLLERVSPVNAKPIYPFRPELRQLESLIKWRRLKAHFLDTQHRFHNSCAVGHCHCREFIGFCNRTFVAS